MPSKKKKGGQRGGNSGGDNSPGRGGSRGGSSNFSGFGGGGGSGDGGVSESVRDLTLRPSKKSKPQSEPKAEADLTETPEGEEKQRTEKERQKEPQSEPKVEAAPKETHEGNEKQLTEKERREEQHLQWIEYAENLPRLGKRAVLPGENAADEINVNYFQLNIKEKSQFTYYDLDIAPLGNSTVAPRRELKESLVKSLLQQIPPQALVWISDYQKFIVCLGPLYKSMEGIEQGDARVFTHMFTTLSGGSINHSITITLNGDADLSMFQRYCQGPSPKNHMSVADVNRCTSVLNAITLRDLRSGGKTPLNGALIGNRFFLRHMQETITIPAVYAIRTGFATSVRPATKGVLLNVHPITSAFYLPMKLDVWMSLFWPNGSPSSSEFASRLRGVKVTFEAEKRQGSNTMPSHSIWSIGNQDIKQQTFLNQTTQQQETVFGYLSQRYPRARVPETGRCINLGTNRQPRWYPAGMLTIIEWQPVRSLLDTRFSDTMIAKAEIRPEQSKRLIMNEARNWLGLKEESFLADYKIKPSNDLLSIKVRTPLIADLRIGTKNMATASGGWNLKKHKEFDRVGLPNFKPPGHLKVMCLCSSDYTGDCTGAYNALSKALYEYKILSAPNEPDPTYLDLDPHLDREQTLAALEAGRATWLDSLQDLKFLKVILVVLDPKQYSDFKYWADCHVGVRTQCVKIETMRKMNRSVDQMTMANICMKFNFKLNGINHKIYKPFSGAFPNTMFVGADVTHPGMIKERVLAWYHHSKETITTKRLPRAIMIYRDGVSESQYGMVLKEEHPQVMEGFKAAVNTLKAEKRFPATFRPAEVLEIFLVATKRHRVRFYPQRKENDSATDINLKPGTVVDSDIINPGTSGFHLQSHDSPLGTAKNGLYTVIFSNVQLDGLGTRVLKAPAPIGEVLLRRIEVVTNNLCYTGSRATKALSIAAPARYADLLCNRLREYMRLALAKPEDFIGTRSISQISNDARLWKVDATDPERQNPWHKNLDGIMFYL
ncbi:piwi domain-containing protein [Phlyctema vagabunda]|uniref:Piwi domain-containing protein n=1 Tax=Phlyctema vagabunda TaxID=108571 RepID=A0ABR4PCZ5_9HELO